MAITLTKKIGPLPTYAWIGVAVLFVGMVWYFRRGSGDIAPVDTSGSEEIGASDYGDTGTTFIGGAGSPGIPYSESYSDYPVSTNTDAMPNQLDWDAFLAGLTAGYSPTPSASIYESPLAPVTTQPVPTPTLSVSPTATATPVGTIAPAKQTSFVWGGETWTKSRETAFRKWLHAHGVTYATWASNHPKAAMDVFGSMS